MKTYLTLLAAAALAAGTAFAQEEIENTPAPAPAPALAPAPAPGPQPAWNLPVQRCFFGSGGSALLSSINRAARSPRTSPWRK